MKSKAEILAEAKQVYDEMNNSLDAESVRQAKTAELMFIAGGFFASDLSPTPPVKEVDEKVVEDKAKDGWISVEDGLPEIYTTCLITDAGTVDMAIYLPDNRWEDKCNNDYHYITHWQPLPEPPKQISNL